MNCPLCVVVVPTSSLFFVVEVYSYRTLKYFLKFNAQMLNTSIVSCISVEDKGDLT